MANEVVYIYSSDAHHQFIFEIVPGFNQFKKQAILRLGDKFITWTSKTELPIEELQAKFSDYEYLGQIEVAKLTKAGFY